MNEILAIALNTQKEAIRNKVFYIILLFVLLLLASSILLGTLALGEQDRVVKHLGLSAINVFGLLLAAFVGVTLVYEELDKRTIYTIIATGVRRYQFIVGKFLGLLLTVINNVLVMAVILCLFANRHAGLPCHSVPNLRHLPVPIRDDGHYSDCRIILLILYTGAVGGFDFYLLHHRPSIGGSPGIRQAALRGRKCCHFLCAKRLVLHSSEFRNLQHQESSRVSGKHFIVFNVEISCNRHRLFSHLIGYCSDFLLTA